MNSLQQSTPKKQEEKHLKLKSPQSDAQLMNEPSSILPTLEGGRSAKRGQGVYSSQSSQALGGAQPDASGGKRQKKSTKKLAETSAISTSKKISQQLDLETKYKDINGVSDWFNFKKAELEEKVEPTSTINGQRQRSAIAGFYMPIASHIWRPPRLDQVKYQLSTEQIPPKDVTSGDSTKAVIKNVQQITDLRQSKPVGLLQKRKKRSHSCDWQQKMEEAKIRNKSLLLEDENEEVTQAKPKQEMKFRYEPTQSSEDQSKLNEYLELVDFIMRETLTSSSNGIWLKGSLTSYQEKALQLLHDYKYNYELAKFHILYPGIMAIPSKKEEIMHSLTKSELETIINDAVIDLRGCKSQEAEEAINNTRIAIQNRITVDELNYYLNALKKLRVDAPQDVEEELTRSREFSKLIKKKCFQMTPNTQSGSGNSSIMQPSSEKRMKMQELYLMQQESLNQYFIVTPEMTALADYVSKAKAWQDKAEQAMQQVMSLKSLQTMLQDAKGIPINFEELYENLKKRCNDGQNLVDRIYNTFTKVTKTRTQVSTLTNQDALIDTSRSKKLQEVKPAQLTSAKESHFRGMLSEAVMLQLTHPEITKLREHIDLVDQWKSRVTMFLEDEREQKRKRVGRKTFAGLIKETAVFKFEVELCEELTSRREFIKWHSKALKVYQKWQQIQNDEGNQDSNEEIKESISQTSESESSSDEFIKACSKYGGLITLHKLQQLMDEGGEFLKMDFLPEVQFLNTLSAQSTNFRQQLQSILRDLEEGGNRKHQQQLTDICQVIKEGKQLQVWMEEIRLVEKWISKAEGYVEMADKLIGQSEKLYQLASDDEMEEEETQLQYLQELLKFKTNLNDLHIRHPSMTKLSRLLRPVLTWIESTRSLIKPYLKTLDLQLPFSQLNLLPLLPYDDDNDSQHPEDPMIDEEQVKVAKYDPKHEFQTLARLIEVVEGRFKILQYTKDFKLLKELNIKVEEWVQQLDYLDERKKQKQAEGFSETELQGWYVERLEGLLSVNLPLPSEVQSAKQKQLRREKWLKRLSDLRQSERVKIKQLDILLKESFHVDIQDDLDCKQKADIIIEQYNHCKAWIEQHEKADLNSFKDILALLELGNATLKFKLADYMELKSFHGEVQQWRSVTQKLLYQPKCPLYNYEFARKHIEIGKQLDIEDKELHLLQALVDVCAHWKCVARKLLSSRELAILDNIPLENQNDDALQQFLVTVEKQMLEVQTDDQSSVYQLLQVQTPLDPAPILNEQKVYDNHKYCICRKGDDGLLFMIECDSCKEWFHGQCVGVKDTTSIPSLNTGLSQNIAENTNQQQSGEYVCIGCVRAFYNLFPFGVSEDKQEDTNAVKQQLDGLSLSYSSGFENKTDIDSSQLNAFTSTKRMSYEFFLTVLLEGVRIPIYLEELQQMKQVNEKILRWKERAESILGQGSIISRNDENEISQEEDESYEIINTKLKLPNSAAEEEEEKSPKRPNDIRSQLMKIYLESEGFPCEISQLTHKLLKNIRYLTWFQEANKLIELAENQPLQQISHVSQAGTNNPKGQMKKKLLKAIHSYEQLCLLHPELGESSSLTQVEDLQLMRETNQKLQMLISTQAQQAHPQISQHQQQVQPLQTQQSLIKQQQQTSAQEQLYAQIASYHQIMTGGLNKDQLIDPQQLRQLIGKVDPYKLYAYNQQYYQSFENLVKSLNQYDQWAHRLNECINQAFILKQQGILNQQIIEAYEVLRIEGENVHFALFTSSDEKEDQLYLWERYREVEERSKQLLFAPLEVLLQNPETVHEAWQEVVQAVGLYQQIPFYSQFAEMLTVKYNELVEMPQDAQSIEQQE